ncbi:MAG: RNA polymerase sigma-70 factor [Balneolaceae bacterium]|nr:RNA polymerase sigma-70 factor [Balneolaceae bacterium]
MKNLTDADLSIEIKNGREAAFREIYDRYHEQMYYIAKKYLKSAILSEDAVQDVFIKLWERRNNLDETKSIKGFLFTVLKNHVLNMIRDRKKEILSLSEIHEEQLPQESSTEYDILHQEYQGILEKGMNELSGRKREIFELKTVQGYTNSEIADHLDLNIRTVKTHYYLSLKFIKMYLHKHAGIVIGLVVTMSAILYL